MHPVLAAVVIGGVLYLISDDETDKKKDAKKQSKEQEQPEPTIAELRARLKKAVKEKKKKEQLSTTSATKTESAKIPVSPPKALRPGSTTSGDGGKKRS